MKSSQKLLLIAVLSLSFFFSYAQQNDTLEIQRSKKGKISFAHEQNTKDMKHTGFLPPIIQAAISAEIWSSLKLFL